MNVGNGMGDIFAQLTNAILLLIVAIVILLCVGAYLIYKHRKDAKIDKQEDEAEAEEEK